MWSKWIRRETEVGSGKARITQGWLLKILELHSELMGSETPRGFYNYSSLRSSGLQGLETFCFTHELAFYFEQGKVKYKVHQDSCSRPHGPAPAVRGGKVMGTCASGRVGAASGSAVRGKTGHLLIDIKEKESVQESYLKLGNKVKRWLSDILNATLEHFLSLPQGHLNLRGYNFVWFAIHKMIRSHLFYSFEKLEIKLH